MASSLSSSWAQLGGLMFTARALVDGLHAGRHLSPQTGRGQDFHDYRAYSPGDDLADLDWKLLGRSDRCYIRRYRRQTDLPVCLMVDASSSMAFAGLDAQGRPMSGEGHPTKFHTACLLAAAIAFLVIRQGDRAGLGVFDQRIVHHLPPASTASHLQQICITLERHVPSTGQRGDIAASLKQAHQLMRRRGMVVLISDLLDEPATLFEGLAPLRHDGWEVIVLQALSPQELDLSLLGSRRLQLVDAETRAVVPTQPAQVHAEYRWRMEEHQRRIHEGCVARGVDHRVVTTHQSPAEALRHYLTRRAMVRL